MLKHDITSEPSADNPDVPPGDEDGQDVVIAFNSVRDFLRLQNYTFCRVLMKKQKP